MAILPNDIRNEKRGSVIKHIKTAAWNKKVAKTNKQIEMLVNTACF